MWFISMNHIGTMFFVGGEPMICMHNCTDCKRKWSITARDRGPQQVRRSRFGPTKLCMQRVHVWRGGTGIAAGGRRHARMLDQADLGVPPHLLMVQVPGAPMPRATVICFIVLSLLLHKVRIATGRAVRYAQREDDVPVALQRPRQRPRRASPSLMGLPVPVRTHAQM